MTITDEKRITELEALLEWKDKVFQRFVDMKSGKPGVRFFKLLKIHRAKIAPIAKELSDLLSVRCPEQRRRQGDMRG